MKKSMKDLNSYDVWLLIGDQELYPFSSHGFEFAQGAIDSVTARCSGNIFLNSDGDTFTITNLVPVKNDWVSRVKRFLGLAYSIQVELHKYDIDITTLKEKILNGLENYHLTADEDDSWTFAMLPLSSSKASILEAKDTEQLFKTLDLPLPIDCLDLL